MGDQNAPKAPKAQVLEISGQRLAGTPHVSQRTGSLGWIFNGKVVLPDGTRCQFNGNLTVVGSADAERAAEAVAAASARKATPAKA